jgi:hemerythrin-like domain-containing protein
MDAVEFWRHEHSAANEMLGLLQREIGTFHGGGQPDYELMERVVSSLAQSAARLHRSAPVAAFERVVRRDPGQAIVLNRLAQERLMIMATGAELLERLREVGADALMPRGIVEAAASAYLAYYRHLIAAEQRDLLHRALHLLDDDDWRSIRAAAAREHGGRVGRGFDRNRAHHPADLQRDAL